MMEGKMYCKVCLAVAIVASVFFFASCSTSPTANNQSPKTPQAPQLGKNGKTAGMPQAREAKGVTFTGIFYGDIAHLGFRTPAGQEFDVLPGDEGMPFFLAVNKKIPMDIRVATETVDVPGGKTQTEVLKEVSAGGTTYAKWWAEQKSKMTIAEIRQKYDPLVQECTQ